MAISPEDEQEYIQAQQDEHDKLLGPVSQPESAKEPEPGSLDASRDWYQKIEEDTNRDLQEAHDALLGKVGEDGGGKNTQQFGPDPKPKKNTQKFGPDPKPKGSDDVDNPRKWTRDTAKALDLSDASRVGEYSQEPDDLQAMNGAASAASEYMRRMADLLRSMQAMIIENTLHIEELQSRFHRMR